MSYRFSLGYILRTFNHCPKKLLCENRTDVMGHIPSKYCMLPFFFTGVIILNFQKFVSSPVKVFSIQIRDKHYERLTIETLIRSVEMCSGNVPHLVCFNFCRRFKRRNNEEFERSQITRDVYKDGRGSFLWRKETYPDYLVYLTDYLVKTMWVFLEIKCSFVLSFPINIFFSMTEKRHFLFEAEIEFIQW